MPLVPCCLPCITCLVCVPTHLLFTSASQSCTFHTWESYLLPRPPPAHCLPLPHLCLPPNHLPSYGPCCPHHTTTTTFAPPPRLAPSLPACHTACTPSHLPLPMYSIQQTITSSTCTRALPAVGAPGHHTTHDRARVPAAYRTLCACERLAPGASRNV